MRDITSVDHKRVSDLSQLSIRWGRWCLKSLMHKFPLEQLRNGIGADTKLEVALPNRRPSHGGSEIEAQHLAETVATVAFDSAIAGAASASAFCHEPTAGEADYRLRSRRICLRQTNTTRWTQWHK